MGDQWKPPQPQQDLSSKVAAAAAAPSHSLHDPRKKRGEMEKRVDPDGGGCAARKVQKADREKLRRERLNEHFLHLGNTIDPDRPRNDKGTILTETIQILKDLTAEVNILKTEHKALSEESRDLMQEKNELREEKASIKSDIENLNAQYQQRVRFMFPWTAVDHSVVMAPPYSYPIPIPIPPPGPNSIHPSLQPFPFFGNQNPGHIPNSCSTYIPFSAPANPQVELASAQYASTSHVSSQRVPRSKSPCQRRCSDSHDVATELELKMPGSSTQQDSASGGRKGKHSARNGSIIVGGSASSRNSSCHGLQDSSNSVGDIPKADN
ncbi:hypothetical protein RIF29_37298 [Crotalaria pallida]|uniref:BHLH domain-containing protein n=1 Tax=Crotalaria pallida TaxID=3830 RepID=A0AAN9HW88_CROPI